MDLLSDYDYELPDAAIAQVPLTDRSASRLLCLHRSSGETEHLCFRAITSILEPGDLLVLNDTRVSALRLLGNKATGGAVELLLLREIEPGLYEALAKPGKRLKPGAPLCFENGLEASIVSSLDDGRKEVRFASHENLLGALKEAGRTPLPPYIHTELLDDERYQTVYAEAAGSSAAPTAGLHFTPEILDELRAMGVETATVTLDVGLDTFRPIQVENLGEHRMHGERCSLPSETANAIARCTGRIIAVGTTAVRTLESFAVGRRRTDAGSKSTSLFIRPGFEFRIVDGMFTNFHMPRTSMLLMISALAGREQVLRAYEEALRENYRFLSFGDSMLIL